MIRCIISLLFGLPATMAFLPDAVACIANSLVIKLSPPFCFTRPWQWMHRLFKMDLTWVLKSIGCWLLLLAYQTRPNSSSIASPIHIHFGSAFITIF